MALYDRKTHRVNDPAGWTIADFNETDDIDPQYRNIRWAQAVNGLPSELPEATEVLTRLLTEAVGALRSNPNDGSEAALRGMADIYSFLHNAERLMPLVQCWIITKNYDGKDQAWHDANPGSSWRPSVWPAACSTQEQAEAIAEVLREKYTRAGDPTTDTWVVSYGFAKPSTVLRPDVTADDYKRNLG